MRPTDEERQDVLALLAVRFLLPDAKWRLATLDGVRVIFAPASEIATSARNELAKLDTEDGLANEEADPAGVAVDTLRVRYLQTAVEPAADEATDEADGKG